MRAPRWVAPAVVVLVLVLVVGGVAGALVLGSRGRGQPAAAPPTTRAGAPSAELDAGGEELVSLLAQARDRTYHARYEGRGPEGEARSLTIELWRKGGLVRQDAETVDQGGRSRSATLQIPAGVFTCRRSGDGPWRCDRAPAGQQPADPLLGRLAGDLDGRDVTARDAEVGGRSVRCFVAAGGGDDTEICATRDGVLVRVASAGARLELVELTEAVDDAVFVPPA